jgi:predicted DNA-binding protein YlxM (UPF0122 family)
METKFDFEKIKEMVIAKKTLRVILQDLNMSEVMFYRSITEDQRNELKKIRNVYVANLNPEYIFKKYLQGCSVSELANENRVSTATINLVIDRGLDIYRNNANKVSEIEYIKATDPMKQYRDELLNFMLSPEGTSLPQEKLLRMINEVKDLNDYLQLQ